MARVIEAKDSWFEKRTQVISQQGGEDSKQGSN